MRSVRMLLLECRSALRRADPAFETSPLRAQIDEALLELGRPQETPDPTPEVPVPETCAAQQVAYAWQIAARDLRFTHPDLHVQLGERVRKLLDATVLDDPAIETHRLQAEVESAQALAEATRRDLDELRQALADAVPGVDDKVPPAEAARLRLRRLIEAGLRGGTGVPSPVQHRATDPHDITPTRETLREVAAGRRSLSREQREWCVTEAMVLSGFTRTPAQLLADGEQALARILLDGAPATH